MNLGLPFSTIFRPNQSPILYIAKKPAVLPTEARSRAGTKLTEPNPMKEPQATTSMSLGAGGKMFSTKQKTAMAT